MNAKTRILEMVTNYLNTVSTETLERMLRGYEAGEALNIVLDRRLGEMLCLTRSDPWAVFFPDAIALETKLSPEAKLNGIRK